MRKFWKKQIKDLGGDADVLIKSRTQIAKEMLAAVIATHRTAITMKNTGYLIGRAAREVVKPCQEFIDGVQDGFARDQ
jgi:hypothetical protein